METISCFALFYKKLSLNPQNGLNNNNNNNNTATTTTNNNPGPQVK